MLRLHAFVLSVSLARWLKEARGGRSLHGAGGSQRFCAAASALG
jgi:hypothetical protein